VPGGIPQHIIRIPADKHSASLRAGDLVPFTIRTGTVTCKHGYDAL
jgi:hypothetical protein